MKKRKFIYIKEFGKRMKGHPVMIVVTLAAMVVGVGLGRSRFIRNG